MDKPNSGVFSFYNNPYSNSESNVNVPINPSIAPLSPYLNFDPAVINQGGPEFIFPEGASRQRGRLELAFSQIGGSVITGAALGGMNGLYTGVRETSLAGHIGSVRRTQILNFITKRGAVTANTLGVVALMYSAFGVLLSNIRGTDDELNTVTSGVLTGLLYKSSSGIKKCLLGGSVGAGLSVAYVLWTSKDRLQDLWSRNTL